MLVDKGFVFEISMPRKAVKEGAMPAAGRGKPGQEHLRGSLQPGLPSLPRRARNETDKKTHSRPGGGGGEGGGKQPCDISPGKGLLGR